ncbi:MAG TPA: IPT/TIG domain-containing protein, partial [Myxococcota bacterium]
GFAYEPPAPRVDSIAPALAPTTGATEYVRISGAFFSTRNGVPHVTFGDAAATDVVFVDTQDLDALPPVHAATVVSVTVQNRLSSSDDTQLSLASNAHNFAFVQPVGPAPVVDVVSPASGAIDGGDVVEIDGSGFADGATVSFGGSSATEVSVDSATVLHARTPGTDAARSVRVVVVNVDGQAASLADGFSYFVPPPHIDSALPPQAPTAGGSVVVLSGGGLRAGAIVSFVVGGVSSAAASVNVVSPSTILVGTPSMSAAATADIVVQNPDAQSAVLHGFRFVAPEGPAPRILSIDPASGAREQAQQVTIHGESFRNPAVLVGSASVTPSSFDDSTIVVSIPASTIAGPAVVRVSDDDGQSDTSIYTYVTTLGQAPRIFSLSPSAGPPSGGTRVEIDGAAFVDDNGIPASLSLGGVLIGAPAQSAQPGPGQMVSLTSSTIVFLTPVSAGTGTASVIVENSAGQTATAAFTYQAPQTGGPALGPTVDATDRSTVHALVPGDDLVLIGSGLEQVATASVDGQPAVQLAVTATSSDSVRVHFTTAPAAGHIVVRVSGASGTAASPSVDARAPTVFFTNIDEHSAPVSVLVVGDSLAPDRIANLSLVGSGAPIACTVDQASESTIVMHARSALAPGVVYGAQLDYGSGVVIGGALSTS